MREQPPAATGASPNAPAEPPEWLQWTRNLGVAAAAGVFLAVIGAVETAELPLIRRLLYWVPLMIGGALFGHIVAMMVRRVPHARVNPWIFGAVETVILAVPITLLVWGYSNFLFGTDTPVAALPYLFGTVLVISAAMTSIMILIHWPGRVTHAPPAGAPAPSIRFMDRLPPKLKGAIIHAVSAEDHYLRLHTSKGSDIILMRLSDAIAELEGLEGAQTHRSWWVARDAVEGARRDGDRVTPTLKGGVEAPVSRPNIRPLREAGWY